MSSLSQNFSAEICDATKLSKKILLQIFKAKNSIKKYSQAFNSPKKNSGPKNLRKKMFCHTPYSTKVWIGAPGYLSSSLKRNREERSWGCIFAFEISHKEICVKRSPSTHRVKVEMFNSHVFAAKKWFGFGFYLAFECI